MRINIGFKAIFFEKAIRKRQYTVNHIELGVGSELECGVDSIACSCWFQKILIFVKKLLTDEH